MNFLDKKMMGNSLKRMMIYLGFLVLLFSPVLTIQTVFASNHSTFGSPTNETKLSFFQNIRCLINPVSFFFFFDTPAYCEQDTESSVSPIPTNSPPKPIPPPLVNIPNTLTSMPLEETVSLGFRASTTFPVTPTTLPNTNITLSRTEVRSIIFAYLNDPNIQIRLQGLQGPRGLQGPKGDPSNSSGQVAPSFNYSPSSNAAIPLSYAPIGIIQPNPATNFAGATFFSATNLSSGSFSTGTANITDLTVKGSSVFTGTTTFGSLNVTGATTFTTSAIGTLSILEGGASPSFYSIFQGGDQATNITYTLPTAQGVINTVLTNNGAGVLSWAAAGASQTPWTSNINAAGFTLFGNSTASGNLTLDSTSNATKGFVLLNPSGGNVGIGTATPAQKLDVVGSIALPTTTSSTTGVIYKGADRFIHNFALAGTDGFNTFVGINAGNFTMTGSTGGQGSDNTAVGVNALQSNTTGGSNSAQGSAALQNNTTGFYNNAFGYLSLNKNTEGNWNNAFGYYSLWGNTLGNDNSAFGDQALTNNTTGNQNSAQGSAALRNNTTGNNNSAQGVFALLSSGGTITAGAFITGIPYTIRVTGTTDFTLIGAANSNPGTVFTATGVGTGDGTASSNSNNNVAVGFSAGRYITGGATALNAPSNSTFLGQGTMALSDGGTNETVIGYLAIGVGSNSVVLGNDSVTKTILKGNVGIGLTAPTAKLHIAQTITATGALTGIIYTGAVNTNQTLNTEIPSLTITTAGRQWATSTTLATQREVLITQPTYSFVASSTITDAATLAIVGAPIRSTNALITNTHALLIQAGAVSTATNSYGLTVNAQTGATNNYAAAFMGGNVGIGTSSPTSLFDINAASNPRMRFRVNNASSGFTIGNNTGSSEVYLWNELNTRMVFGTNSTQRMVILEGGNVGIGTTTPVGLLHVSSDIAATGLTFLTQANASTDSFDLNFRKARGTGASPTVITTADELGVVNFTGYGGAAGYITGAAIKGISSGTIADSRVPGQLSFWTGTNAAPSVLTERMTILNDGNVGIGTASPGTTLHVVKNGNALRLEGTDHTYMEFYPDGPATRKAWLGFGGGADNYITLSNEITGGHIILNPTAAGNIGIGNTAPAYKLEVGSTGVSGIVSRFVNSTGTCDINPTTTALVCASDITLKKNIVTLDGIEFVLKSVPTTGMLSTTNTLERILSLTPVTYNWNTEMTSDAKHPGFIAQEMELYFPDIVATDPITGLKSIAYSNLNPYLVKAIQEMNLKVDGVDARLAALEASAGGSGAGQSLGEFAVSFFNSVVTKVENGVAYMTGLVVDVLKVGSPSKRTGITFYDEVTGEPYCLSIANGITKTVAGECGIITSIPVPTPDLVPIPEPTLDLMPTPEPTLDLVPTPEPTPILDPVIA